MLQAQAVLGVMPSLVRLPQRYRGFQMPGRRRALDGHEPFGMPGRIATAVLTHAAALIDLQLIIGSIIAVEIEQDADPVEGVQIRAACAILDGRHLFSVRMLAAHGEVEEVLVKGEPGPCRTLLSRVAGGVFQLQRPGAVPARIVEIAVQERLLRGQLALSQGLGQPAVAVARQPQLRGGGIVPRSFGVKLHVLLIPFVGRLEVAQLPAQCLQAELQRRIGSVERPERLELFTKGQAAAVPLPGLLRIDRHRQVGLHNTLRAPRVSRGRIPHVDSW